MHHHHVKILWWLAAAVATAAIALPVARAFVVVVPPSSSHAVRRTGGGGSIGICRDPRHPATILSASAPTSSSSSVAPTTTPVTLDSCLVLLTRAAETKAEDSDLVVQALVDLERLARDQAKQDNGRYATDLLRNLNGSWRLIFTTGTKTTQDKFGKVNYFPIKAVQSFDTTTMAIENGIYAGDFALLKFAGTFDYDTKKRKIEFDFTKLTLLQLIDVTIGRGQAAQIGASTGLGSENNVANAAKEKRAFFNWISANADIATARGGGGGLALWKRVA
jgi:hypothetical protein